MAIVEKRLEFSLLLGRKLVYLVAVYGAEAFDEKLHANDGTIYRF
jgi:hypothetical protein